MSCCQAAQLVPRYFFEHDEGIDGLVSSSMKIKVVAPVRYGLEDQSCLPSTRPAEFVFLCSVFLAKFFLCHCGPCTAVPSLYPVSPCQKKNLKARSPSNGLFLTLLSLSTETQKNEFSQRNSTLLQKELFNDFFWVVGVYSDD